jgi:hypothetical protein
MLGHVQGAAAEGNETERPAPAQVKKQDFNCKQIHFSCERQQETVLR